MIWTSHIYVVNSLTQMNVRKRNLTLVEADSFRLKYLSLKLMPFRGVSQKTILNTNKLFEITHRYNGFLAWYNCRASIDGKLWNIGWRMSQFRIFWHNNKVFGFEYLQFGCKIIKKNSQMKKLHTCQSNELVPHGLSF